jgi:hypothetical protein
LFDGYANFESDREVPRRRRRNLKDFDPPGIQCPMQDRPGTDEAERMRAIHQPLDRLEKLRELGSHPGSQSKAEYFN